MPPLQRSAPSPTPRARASRCTTRLCRSIAGTPPLASLLLEAPPGQRLPVLLLAALHDVVLGDPDVALARWYPSVGGDPLAAGDLDRALRSTVDGHRGQILDRLHSRQVQTNEVNRSVAYRASAGGGLHRGSPAAGARGARCQRPGSTWGSTGSASSSTAPGSTAPWARPTPPSTSPPGCAGRRRPELADTIPPVVARMGIDQRPLDPTDADDARWLTACVWPEQQVRVQQLHTTLAVAGADPPHRRAGRSGRRSRHAARRDATRLPCRGVVVVGTRVRRPRPAHPPARR